MIFTSILAGCLRGLRRFIIPVLLPISSILMIATPALAASTAADAMAAAPSSQATHTFEIGKTDFLLDGKPFVIRCGEIHFPRVPREYWRQRLQMCHAMGLNTVCVYLFWNYHEWEEGKYNWSGQADVSEFCKMAQEEGLWVILRPGPYSCAEWEMGGLPWWLLKNDDIKLRTTDPKFLGPATAYLKEVGRVLGPEQITHGGPLLMVQVENEYGSFGNDPVYMGALRQALIDGGFNVPLFACNPQSAILNGHRDDLFQVVNFGVNAAERAFQKLATIQKTGPLMNGGFDMWGRRHHTGATDPIIHDLKYMLDNDHSFSMYMAHGGTSFALWSGADRPFQPDTSSYDYDAPISEAGWETPKFDAIRALFSKYLQPGEKIPDIPAHAPVITIPPFQLTQYAAILQNLPEPKKDDTPHTMEFYDQSRGCTLYRTMMTAGPAGKLSIQSVHDYGWVFLDGKLMGIMDRRRQRYTVDLPERTAKAQLDVLVEAAGRVNFGAEVADRKGIHEPVVFTPENSPGAMTLKGWEIFALPLDDAELASLHYRATEGFSPGGACFWRGTFDVPSVGDTFLDMHQWGQGVTWVNGHCLGRFWNIGPTQTMYCPGPWLKEGKNEIVILDLPGPQSPTIAGVDKPVLDELHPELDFSRRARATGTFSAAGIAPAADGSFVPTNDIQDVTFAKPATGRYLCLEALDAFDGHDVAAVAELDALGAKGASLSKANWKIFWADSEETHTDAGEAENVLDGQPSSAWITESSETKPPFPHRIVVDLGQSQEVAGIRYLPRAGDPRQGGRIKDYRVYVSDQPFGLTPAQ
jgi:beta-galactosidase